MDETTETTVSGLSDIATSVSSAGIVDSIAGVATDLVPVLLPLMAVFIGINMIPRLVRKFSN